MTLASLRAVSLTSFVTLLILSVLWEAWLAPSRYAGFWLIAKVLPLLVLAPGILKDRIGAYIGACLIALLFIAEASVLAYTRGSRVIVSDTVFVLACIELVVVSIFFVSTALYVRKRREAISASQAHAKMES